MKRKTLSICTASLLMITSYDLNGADVQNFPEIILGDPIVVAQAPPEIRNWGPWQFPAISRLPDGRLMIGYHIAEDAATAYGAQPGVAISDDNGGTWKTTDATPAPATWTSKSLTLSNGDLLRQVSLKSRTVADIQQKLPPPLTTWTAGYGEKYIIYSDKDMPVELAGWRFARLKKNSTTWVEETAEVHIPNDIRVVTGGVLVFPWIHRIKIAPDGGLWGIGFTLRVVNRVMQKQLSVYFLRSVDAGHTWNLLAEIPYQPDQNMDKFWDQREGFTEPDITFAPDGSILCLIRTTDGSGIGPLYQSRSMDNGKTWSKPAVFDDLGVWPIFLRMENSVTLVSYGRPGLYVRATQDPSCESWGPRIPIVNPAKLGTDTCSYSDLLALDSKTALIVYSDFNYPDNQGQPCKTILVRKLAF
jgi:hypothetical protein